MGVTGSPPHHEHRSQVTMLPLILALVASAVAVPDPVRLFETIDTLETSARSTGVGIRTVLQDQGVALAEETFDSTLNKSKCMAFELCMHGADEMMDAETAPAISALTDFLTCMKETASRKTKNIDSLLAAVQVGRALGERACASLYICDQSPAVSTGPSKRITCETLANICPGPACTFAGIYCGVSGYS